MTPTPPAARQWYRLNDAGMPERVSDDYAYANKAACYADWETARSMAVSTAEGEYDAARGVMTRATARVNVAYALPEADPHA